MQSKNPFLNDISNLMTNAFSVAQSAKGEVETILNSKIDDWLSRRDFVSREEFEVLRLRVDKLVEENNKLQSDIAKINKKK